MRVLVTGGTGFIGRALVAALQSRGDETVVLSRRDGPGRVPWDALEHEVARADAVVHLAGEPIAEARWTPERIARIRESRVGLTAAIARTIAGASHKPRVLISGSAVGFYGTRKDDRILDEASPAGADLLAEIVVAWEAAANPAREAGVRIVHPRTGVVLGRDGGALPRMTVPFRFFMGGPIGDGRQWVSWIHLRDMVQALVFAIDTDGLAGAVNLTAPEPVTMRELAHAIGHAMHRPALVPVPGLALRAALGDGLAQMILTGQRAIPTKLLQMGFSFEFTAVARACADLLG
ncbi:MAG TPA: TIGR01777 family oxidoreductase [Polyangiaceae bacterium]